jgi:hypothetical protein
MYYVPCLKSTLHINPKVFLERFPELRVGLEAWFRPFQDLYHRVDIEFDAHVKQLKVKYPSYDRVLAEFQAGLKEYQQHSGTQKPQQSNDGSLARSCAPPSATPLSPG